MSGRDDIVVKEGEPIIGTWDSKRRLILLSLGNLHRSVLQMADGDWLVDSESPRSGEPWRIVKTEGEAVEAAKDLLVISDARLRLGARW